MAYTARKDDAGSRKKTPAPVIPQTAQSRSGAASGRREFAAQEARLQSVVEALKTRHGSSLGLFLYDLDAGKKEIEALENALNSLEREASLAQSRSALQNTYLGAPVRQDFDFRRNAEQTRAVQQALSGKKQAYDLAKRYQEAVAYGDTVKNGDFHRLSAYVPSEDPLYNWINDPAYRESYEAQYSKTFRTAFRDSPYTGQKASPFARSGYDRMSESETAIYNYYYAKEGREAAQKYLDSIQESLNARTAEDLYGTVSGDAGLEILFGAAASVEGFEGDVRSAFNFKDDHIAKTPHRIASSKVREDLADTGARLPGWLGGGSLGQLAYDAVGAAAYMAPSVLVSYATGIPMAGNALSGIGAAGGAYRQALNEGFSKDQARGYSTLVGMSEVAMEKLLGGISAYGGNRLGKKAVQNLANVDDALKMLGGKLGGSMLGEFREEYLQEVLDPVIRHITLKTEEEMNLLSPDALYSGFLGALLGPGIESVDAAVNGLPVEFNDIDTPSEKAVTPTIDDAEMDAIFEGIEDLDGWKRLKSLPKAEQEAFISSLTLDALKESTPTTALEDAEFAEFFEGLEGSEGWEHLKSLPKAEQEAFIETLFEEDSVEEGIPVTTEEIVNPEDEISPTNADLAVEESENHDKIEIGAVTDSFDRKIRLTESTEDLQKTNPNYEKREYQWRNNCQRCVPTYEMRRRGYKVTAKPILKKVSEDFLANNYTAAWENQDRIWCMQENGLQQIKKQMSAWGDGARAEISITWKNSGTGHVFVAEQRNGVTVFIDPQTGNADCSLYFENVVKGKTNILRIDNNSPSDLILDCCENGGG